MLAQTLLPLLLSILYATTSSAAKCQCGFLTTESPHLVFTDYLETDFTRSTVDGWVPQNYTVSTREARGPYGKNASVENVVVGNEGLKLFVRPAEKDKLIPMAEVDSERVDMLYGSFRIRAKMSGVNGTCGAFFWFWNNTQEIDMEFLSRQLPVSSSDNTGLVNLVIQSKQSEAQGYNAQGTSGFEAHTLPFRPDTDFHEYRFDWVPGKVSFYADNVLLKIMTDEIPNAPGHIVLNHWSNGDQFWSGGPPEQDAAMTVTHAHLYFNSSKVDLQKAFSSTCSHPDKSKQCTINDDIRIPLMSTVSTPSSTSHNATDPNTIDAAAKKKAMSKGSWGFIIVGCVVGLFIVVFIVAMITVRHWRTWRRKLGWKRAQPVPNDVSDSERRNGKANSPSSSEMGEKKGMLRALP